MYPSPFDLLPGADYPARHLGPGPLEQQAMLASLGLDSLESLVAQALPAPLRHESALGVGVITSYSIHYTKLYELACPPRAEEGRRPIHDGIH